MYNIYIYIYIYIYSKLGCISRWGEFPIGKMYRNAVMRETCPNHTLMFGSLQVHHFPGYENRMKTIRFRTNRSN